MQIESGLFFEAVRDAELIWTADSMAALQHSHIEAASENLYKLREYYNVEEALRLEPALYYADPKHPSQWFFDPMTVLRQD